MTNRATFGAVLLMGMLTVACTSNSGTSLRSATSGPNASAGATAQGKSAPGTLVPTSKPEAGPTIGQPLTPPLKTPSCPPYTANLIGCPLPPQPIGGQTSRARIALCHQPIVAVAAPITVAGFVCGAGFHSGELVTITVSGRLARISWQVTAQPDGTFRSALPLTACRVVPALLTARGNSGSVSNVVALILVACRPIP